jgi:hypothetical protein
MQMSNHSFFLEREVMPHHKVANIQALFYCSFIFDILSVFFKSKNNENWFAITICFSLSHLNFYGCVCACDTFVLNFVTNDTNISINF